MVSSPHWEGDPEEQWKEEGGRSVLKARGLYVYWGHTSQYWRIPPPKSDRPAILLNVCTLEVSATKEINPGKCYEVGFSVTLTRKWIPNTPIYIMAKRGEKGNLLARRVYFDRYNLNEKFDIPGDFVVKFSKEGSYESKIHIHLYDHWTDHWKSNLLIHHAFVREVNDDNNKEK